MDGDFYLNSEFVRVDYKGNYYDYFKTEDFPFSEYNANGFDWKVKSVERKDIPIDILKLLDA